MMTEIEYPKKWPLETEFQSLLQRTWLWVTAEKSVWCLLVGTYPKSTPWELAADGSYRRYSYYTVTQATAGAAAGSADLSTLAGAGHWGIQEGTKPLPLALSCVSLQCPLLTNFICCTCQRKPIEGPRSIFRAKGRIWSGGTIVNNHNHHNSARSFMTKTFFLSHGL